MRKMVAGQAEIDKARFDDAGWPDPKLSADAAADLPITL
jgi:hypothetical protein